MGLETARERIAVWGFVPGAVVAVTTDLFGRATGQKIGKTEAYKSSIATVRDKPDSGAAVRALRDDAEGHGIKVTT
jgi:hypothetical protein